MPLEVIKNGLFKVKKKDFGFVCLIFLKAFKFEGK